MLSTFLWRKIKNVQDKKQQNILSLFKKNHASLIESQPDFFSKYICLGFYGRKTKNCRIFADMFKLLRSVASQHLNTKS